MKFTTSMVEMSLLWMDVSSTTPFPTDNWWSWRFCGYTYTTTAIYLVLASYDCLLSRDQSAVIIGEINFTDMIHFLVTWAPTCSVFERRILTFFVGLLGGAYAPIPTVLKHERLIDTFGGSQWQTNITTLTMMVSVSFCYQFSTGC